MQEQLLDRLNRQKEALRMEMEGRVLKSKEEEREKADEERAARMKEYNELEQKIAQLENALREKERQKVKENKERNLSLKSLLFVRCVLMNDVDRNELEKRISELRIASGGDDVIVKALNSLPERM